LALGADRFSFVIGWLLSTLCLRSFTFRQL
jgi:hypothetical protein